MRFLGRARRPSPVGPRKNQWKDPQGERAAKEASRAENSQAKGPCSMGRRLDGRYGARGMGS